MRLSRKIKYIPKHIFFTRKKTEIMKRVVVPQIFPCAINTLNTTVTRFFAAWARGNIPCFTTNASQLK